MHNNLHLVFLILLIISCSSDNSLSDEPTSSTTVIEYKYLELNQWIYQQMNHDYFWREDMPDSVDCNYELYPTEFFKRLLSLKDRFSYITSNSNNFPPSELGFAYQKYHFKGKNHIYEVLYIKNPELKKQGMKRGDFIEISSSNGFHLYKKLNIEGQEVNYSGVCFREPITTRRIENSNTVLLDSVYYINERKIGYICYLEFDNISDLYIPLRHFHKSKIDEIIIDLRYNPGGYVKTCKYLCNCIIPSESYGKVFQKCRYNNTISEEYLQSTGLSYTTSLFQAPPSSVENLLGTSIVPLNQKKVYFITSSHTASASEAAIICLRPYMEVIVIGEKTVGKGVGSWTISAPQYKFALQPITMRYYNALEETTPDEGLTPDYYVAEGYSISKKEIGDVNEPLLNTAISLIIGKSIKVSSKVEDDLHKIFYKALTPVEEPSYVSEFRNKHH